jgi:hypothetical protein
MLQAVGVAEALVLEEDVLVDCPDVELAEVLLDDEVVVFGGQPFNFWPSVSLSKLQSGFVFLRSSKLQPSFDAMAVPLSFVVTVYVAGEAGLVEEVEEVLDEEELLDVEDMLLDKDEVPLDDVEELVESEAEVDVEVMFEGIGMVPFGQLPPGTFRTWLSSSLSQSMGMFVILRSLNDTPSLSEIF